MYMLLGKMFTGFKVRRQYRDVLDTVITLKQKKKQNHKSHIFSKMAFIIFVDDAFLVWCNS